MSKTNRFIVQVNRTIDCFTMVRRDFHWWRKRNVVISHFDLDFAEIQVQLSSLSDVLEQIKSNSTTNPSISSRSNVKVIDGRMKRMLQLFSFHRMEVKQVEVIHHPPVSAVSIPLVYSMLNVKIIMKCRRKVRIDRDKDVFIFVFLRFSFW